MDSATEISSDSEVEIQETRTILPHPRLPPQGSHRRELSALRPHLVIGTSSNSNRLTRVVRLPGPSSSRNGFEAKPLTNGHIGSQQIVKRVLPPSLIRPPMPLRPDIVGTSNGNRSHFRGVYATPAASASGSNDNFGGGSYGGFHHDGIGMGRVIKGDKLYPPYVPHATAALTSHFNGGSDPLHRNGMGEEMSSKNDERLIYQTALQVFIVIPSFGLCRLLVGLIKMSMCNERLSFISSVVSGTELEQ